jgi:hypothetical protein
MASLEEELRQDELDDAREKAYFRQNLSQEQNARLTDDDLQLILDTIVEYYATSGIFDNANGDVDVDAEAVAQYVMEKTAAEKHSPFDKDDLTDIVVLELDYSDAD